MQNPCKSAYLHSNNSDIAPQKQPPQQPNSRLPSFVAYSSEVVHARPLRGRPSAEARRAPPPGGVGAPARPTRANSRTRPEGCAA